MCLIKVIHVLICMYYYWPSIEQDSKSVSSDVVAYSSNKTCDGDIMACPWLIVLNRCSKSSNRLANILNKIK